MYDNWIHTVPQRIVSISQLFTRLIIRRKLITRVKSSRILLIGTISGKAIIPKESWRIKSTGTGKTCSTASQKGSVCQALPWGQSSVDKRAEYTDNADRVEVERAFSLSKQSFGMGLKELRGFPLRSQSWR